MFKDFTDLSKRLAEDEDLLVSDELKADLKKLFDISEETKFVKEIKDIRDELHIISTVLEDQETVLVDMDEAIQAMKAGKSTGGEPKKPQSTTPSYHSLYERVRRHIRVVKGLDDQAAKTYLSVRGMFRLAYSC
jgi:predicted RNA-binding protein associated with RNAse of E/G family